MDNSTRFNVLIVDDRPENLLTLEGILESENLNIIKAHSGNEALGIMLENNISLVLMDVQMPGMDGFEVAEIMRSSEKTKFIPIIFITAISKQRQHIFRGYETGAVDYLYKPLDLEILQSKIKAFIEFFQHKNALEETTRKLAKTIDELNAAKRIAEEATNAKSSFLATMSHEIRTPLNGIIGMADLSLMDDEISAVQKERLLDIKASGESLLEIINEILDISKIEADKLELEEIEFSIRELIKKVVNLLSVKVFQEKLEFTCRVSPELPDIIIGDPLRLRQVLINLISNAIKFTEEGTVALDVNMIDNIEEQLSVEFAVEDTGIGILKEKMGRLFDSYTQAETSISRTHGGTGLGLSISQKLVNLMGSQIKVSSSPGEGSRFSFRLNLITGEQPETPWQLKLTKPNQDFHVLVIDDHERSAKNLSELLKSWNIKCTIAHDCEQAAKAVKSEIFDLVMIDFYLHEMNGADAAEKIKELLSGKTLPEFLLLSPTKANIDILKLKKANQHNFISKPILQNDLKTYLESKFGQLKVRDNTHKAVATPVISNQKVFSILVAEDQIINRKIVTQLLEKKGWLVKAVENGKIACEIATSQHFDIILMDVQMPEMDGFEATRLIRKAEANTNKHTPIVAMTAHAMKGDREKCLEAGMDFYITKPVNPNELFDTIARYALK